MRQNLLGLRSREFGPREAQGEVISMLRRGSESIGLLLAVLVVTGLAIAAVQAGFYVTPEALAPRWSRLSPAAGWSRIMSTASAVKGLAAVSKVCVVAALTWWILRGRGGQIAALSQGTLATAAAQSWDIALRLALAIAAGLVLIGMADYATQRWRHERSIMMSRQELKEETKREEGDPLMRARIRKLARETARKRMMNDVPQASVVITNPTHLAIALRYERGTMSAPKVVAKGAGFVAKRIVELARRHAVPVVERKPVAQALYKAVQIGQQIPAALYYAVAEVLAYVYRLRGAA
jgi:flagellar biosynthetic protein FlhB